MKSFKTLFFLCGIFAINPATAQYLASNVSTQSAEKQIRVIAPDNAGNTIITGSFKATVTIGSTSLSNSYPDVGLAGFTGNNPFIAKRASNGSYAWVKKITINGLPPKASCSPEYSSAGINAVAADSAGNVYLTGFFKGSVSFDGITLTSFQTKGGGCPPWRWDIFTAKIAPSGTFLWAKKEGTDAAWGEFGKGIATDASGNVYVTGNLVQKEYSTTLCTQQYLYVVKYSAGGTKLLEKKYASNVYDCSRILDGTGIACDGSNIYVLGNYLGTVNFGGGYSFSSPGILSTVLLKLDGSGNTIWAKTVSGSENVAGKVLLSNGNSDIHISGSFYPGTASFGNGQSVSYTGTTSQSYLAKYSAVTGNCLWAIKGIGGRPFIYPNGNPGAAATVAGAFTIDEYDAASGSLLTSTAATNMNTGGTAGQSFMDIIGTPNGFMYSQNLKGSYDIGGATISSTQTATSSYFDMMLVEYTTPPSLRQTLPTAIPAVNQLGNESSIRVYPNPAKDVLCISSNNGKDIGWIVVMDQTGRVVKETTAPGRQIQINAASLPSGVYYIKVAEGKPIRILKD